MGFFASLLEVIREDMREKLTLVMLKWRNQHFTTFDYKWPKSEGALYHMVQARQFERHLTLYTSGDEYLWEGLGTMARAANVLEEILRSPQELLGVILVPVTNRDLIERLSRPREDPSEDGEW